MQSTRMPMRSLARDRAPMPPLRADDMHKRKNRNKEYKKVEYVLPKPDSVFSHEALQGDGNRILPHRSHTALVWGSLALCCISVGAAFRQLEQGLVFALFCGFVALTNSLGGTSD